MLALIFVRAAMPMPMGASPFARWALLAGITIRPRATSSRTKLRIELLGAGDRLDFGRHLAGPGILDLGHGLAPFSTFSIEVRLQAVKRATNRRGCEEWGQAPRWMPFSQGLRELAQSQSPFFTTSPYGKRATVAPSYLSVKIMLTLKIDAIGTDNFS